MCPSHTPTAPFRIPFVLHLLWVNIVCILGRVKRFANDSSNASILTTRASPSSSSYPHIPPPPPCCCCCPFETVIKRIKKSLARASASGSMKATTFCAIIKYAFVLFIFRIYYLSVCLFAYPPLPTQLEAKLMPCQGLCLTLTN